MPPSEELSRGRRSRDSRGQSSDSLKRSIPAAPVLRSSSSGVMSIDTLSSKGKGKEVLRPPPLPLLPRKYTSYDSPTASSEAKRSPRAVRKSPMLLPETIPSHPKSSRSHIGKGQIMVPRTSQSPSSSAVSTTSSILDRSRPPIYSRGRPPKRTGLPIIGDVSLARDSPKTPSGHISRPPSRQTSWPPSRHTSRPPSRQYWPSSIAIVDSYPPGGRTPRGPSPGTRHVMPSACAHSSIARDLIARIMETCPELTGTTAKGIITIGAARLENMRYMGEGGRVFVFFVQNCHVMCI